MQMQKNQSHKKILQFNDQSNMVKAFTTKVAFIEAIQKNYQCKYGNNEEWITLGQQLLEFLFIDYLTIKGYPNQQTQLKKTSDILALRQKLFTEKILSDIAIQLTLDSYLQVGKQQNLKTNSKTLTECLKAVIAAQYVDKEYDIEQLREIVAPIIDLMLEKNQSSSNINNNNENPKSLFFEMLQQMDWKVKPRISQEFWQSKVENIPVNHYKFTLQLGNWEVSKEGLNRRETEQKLFQLALNKLQNQPNIYQSQLDLKPSQQKIIKKEEQKGSEFLNSGLLDNNEQTFNQSGYSDNYTQQFLDNVINGK